MSEIFDRRSLRSHVRIWRGDIPIGSGFVVGPRHVMTCAHVVADSVAGGNELRTRVKAPVELKVTMDMQIEPGRFVGRVVADTWRPEGGSAPDGLDDVAVLELCEGELPGCALPAGKTRAVRPQDSIMGYGVGARLEDGVAIAGRVSAIYQNRFLITADHLDAAVRPGCSGAGAWNVDRGGLAGMVAEMQQTQTGRIIPVDLLEKVWPFQWEDELEAAARPPKPSAADLELQGIGGLLEQEATRHLVVTYGEDIRATSECANAVGNLKQLHDLVDQLRRNVYAPLRSIVRRLPAPDAFIDVAQQRGVFLDLRGRIVSTAAEPPFKAGEFPWIDDQLTFAAQDLKQALEERRHELVAEANENLRTVVEVELTSLDSRIADAIRKLDLARLIAKLRALRADLLRNGVDPVRVEALEHDISTLSGIDERTQAVSALHHDWQRVDSLLNSFETALGQGMAAVSNPWRLLSRRLASTCPAEAADALPGAAEAIETVGAAIASGDSVRLWIAFPELATRLRDRFFAIDRDLLEECGHIREAGKSLKSVVEKLDALP